MTSFREQLKKIREKQGLSQTELGDMIDASVQQINRYENSNHEPTAKSIVRLCQALDVSADELLGLPRRYPDRESDLDSRERKLIRYHRSGDGLALISMGLKIEQHKRWQQEENLRRNSDPDEASTPANNKRELKAQDKSTDQRSSEPMS